MMLVKVTSTIVTSTFPLANAFVDEDEAPHWSLLPLAALRRLQHFVVDTEIITWEPWECTVVQKRLLDVISAISRSISHLSLNFNLADWRLATADCLLSETRWAILDNHISQLSNLKMLEIALDIKVVDGRDDYSQSAVDNTVRRTILEQLPICAGTWYVYMD